MAAEIAASKPDLDAKPEKRLRSTIYKEVKRKIICAATPIRLHCDLQRLSCKAKKLSAAATEIAAPKPDLGAKAKKNDLNHFLKGILQRKSGRKICQSSFRHLHAATPIRFATLSCKRF
jgi:predicted nucleotidyltransferase